MPEMWTKRELAGLKRLSSPLKIQRFLNGIPYSADPIYRCPRRVLAERTAHCVDGGMFAAAALRRIGLGARVLWIWSENDDGHMLALFTERRVWGAVGKSNFVNLRYRPPMYRSVRELVMSYFNDYFNSVGDRSMRSYTRPLNLARLDRLNWETSDEGMTEIVDVRIDRQPVAPVMDSKRAAELGPVDARTLEAGLMGARPEGLYVPS